MAARVTRRALVLDTVSLVVAREGAWAGDAIFKQCGAVVLIKALIEKGVIEPPRLYDQAV